MPSNGCDSRLSMLVSARRFTSTISSGNSSDVSMLVSRFDINFASIASALTISSFSDEFDDNEIRLWWSVTNVFCALIGSYWLVGSMQSPFSFTSNNRRLSLWPLLCTVGSDVNVDTVLSLLSNANAWWWLNWLSWFGRWYCSGCECDNFWFDCCWRLVPSKSNCNSGSSVLFIETKLNFRMHTLTTPTNTNCVTQYGQPNTDFLKILCYLKRQRKSSFLDVLRMFFLSIVFVHTTSTSTWLHFFMNSRLSRSN